MRGSALTVLWILGASTAPAMVVAQPPAEAPERQTSVQAEPDIAPEPTGDGRRAEEDASEDGHRLHWRFPELHPVEYAVGIAANISLPLVRWATDTPGTVRWHGVNWFDDTIQDALGNNSPDYETVELLGDITWIPSMIWPFADILFAVLIEDANPHVAWQMFAIAASVSALDGLMSLLLIHTVGRHRPKTRYCLERGGTPEECNADNAKSFPSGHTAGSFTGAGLTCVQHTSLPLYGGGAPDVAACAAALTFATGTGIFRIMADKHYATDVLAGAAIGLTFGWFLPWLTHYRFDGDPGDGTASTGQPTGLMVFPFGDQNGTAGLAATGLF